MRVFFFEFSYKKDYFHFILRYFSRPQLVTSTILVTGTSTILQYIEEDIMDRVSRSNLIVCYEIFLVIDWFKI